MRLAAGASVKFIGGARHGAVDPASSVYLTLSGRIIVPYGRENELYEVVDNEADEPRYSALFVARCGWQFGEKP